MDSVTVWAKDLSACCARVFVQLDVPGTDAAIVADNLVSADLRSVDSHGVACLRRYVNRLHDGAWSPVQRCEWSSRRPPASTSTPGVARANRSLRGRWQSLDIGAGFVTVHDSNRFGSAGYYVIMVLGCECIGIAMTNSAVLAAPMFGRDAMLEPNPISVAAPAGEERPSVLDMATSTVPRGRLEVYSREERGVAPGWATDETGQPMADVARVPARRVRGLLPAGITCGLD